MKRDSLTGVWVLCLGIWGGGLAAACGGSQEPAESPEASPAAEGESSSGVGAAGDTPGDGEHTMPDGTKMEGDEHGGHPPAADAQKPADY